MRILLLGAQGQVGTELQHSLALLGELISCDRQMANLEDIPALTSLIDHYSPTFIVNAAAYTQVDAAEIHHKKAHQINAVAVEAIATIAKKIDAFFIHYSTDYVFDGQKSGPYDENDESIPLNIYGQTKREGELAILNSGCSSLIFRTSWVHGLRGNNFIKTILKLATERSQLNIVSDQWGTPTSSQFIADVTAQAIKSIIFSRHTFPHTLYHLTAKGETTWCDYAKFIVKTAQEIRWNNKLTPENIIPILSKDYATAAQRPLNSRLNTQRLESDFSLKIPSWEDQVKNTLYALCRDKELTS